MSLLRRLADAIDFALLTTPGGAVPIISDGRITIVTVKPHDWRPTAASRRAWLEANYPGSTIERDRLEPEISQ